MVVTAALRHSTPPPPPPTHTHISPRPPGISVPTNGERCGLAALTLSLLCLPRRHSENEHWKCRTWIIMNTWNDFCQNAWYWSRFVKGPSNIPFAWVRVYVSTFQPGNCIGWPVKRLMGTVFVTLPVTINETLNLLLSLTVFLINAENILV